MAFDNVKRKKIISTFIVAVLVIAGIGYGAWKGATRETTPSAITGDAGARQVAEDEKDEKLDVLRTWSRKDCSLAPWLTTDKIGAFREQGIKLVFTGELQANQQIASIISGDNDVASAHPNSLAVAVNGGAKLKGVSRGIIEPGEGIDPKFRHMWWFVNPKNHPEIKSFADLKKIEGKIKISIITPNTCTDFLNNTLADKYGIPQDKFEWVTMPDIQAIQALKQGLVDIAPVHPPFYKGMEDAGAIKVSDSFETGLGALAGLTVYYFREDFIEKKPDLIRRFVKAIIKGQRYAIAHPDQVAEWTSEAIGVPVTGNHWYSDNTSIEEAQFIPWIVQLEKNKIIPEGKLKPADLIVHLFDKVQ